MKILLTFDTNYAPHAATVMESIIQNCPEKLDFAVIYYDLCVDTQHILEKHFASRINSLVFYHLEETVFSNQLKKNTKPLPWVGFNCYLRLFAPMILNDSYVIYLDCDIIVQDNILKILNDIDLSKPVCAVTEYDPAYKNKNLLELKPIERPFVDPLIYEAYWFRAYKNLKINIDAKYFNAGIMIINLDYWRKNNIMEQVLMFLIENPEKTYSADQDALNHIINGDFQPLHPKWNNAVVYNAVFTNYSTEKLETAYSKPSIIHAAGTVKPWHYMGNTKYQKIYLKYRKLTPWKKIEYEDVSIKQIFIKFVFLPIMKFIKKIFFIIFGRYRKYSLISLLKLNASDNSFWAKARL
jgi:lipopolysaccharide biosynthesis glycosyltransferase